MTFTTQLVGVCNATPSPLCSKPGAPSTPLYQWTWSDNFNGGDTGTGGIFDVQTSGVLLPVGSTGTGGVAVTNINGAQLPPVVPPSQIATTASGLAYSRVTKTFNGTVTIQNISGSPINGPFQIVFFWLTSNVTLANETGDLSGTPYLAIPGVGSLAPGQKATVTVQFKDPSNAPINFTPVIYSGSIN